MKKLITPIKNKKILENLRAGEFISISGVLYTARDKAHQRLVAAIKGKKSLPVDLKNQFLYYTGPTPARPGKISGAIGPTTSSRMDVFTPEILSLGLAGMIGKGQRNQDVIKAIKKYKAVYLVTIGGAAAYLAKKIKSFLKSAYPDLGTEGIFKIEVEDFPVLVAVDTRGKSIY